ERGVGRLRDRERRAERDHERGVLRRGGRFVAGGSGVARRPARRRGRRPAARRSFGEGAAPARAARGAEDRLRLVQPDDARREREGAGEGVGVPAGAGPAGGHVPAHAARRVGRAADAMRVCLMIEGQEGVSWPQWVALAEACEETGIDGLFRSDHYISMFGDGFSLDAWATINALAARTTRIRLGTMVTPVTFRRPAVLANLVATADQISGGRIELGLGAGWNEREHETFGFPFPELRER